LVDYKEDKMAETARFRAQDPSWREVPLKA